MADGKDCGQGGWVTGNPDKDSKTGNINSWCDPYKTWMKAITYDPYANLTSDAQKELVVGGTSLSFTEIFLPANAQAKRRCGLNRPTPTTSRPSCGHALPRSPRSSGRAAARRASPVTPSPLLAACTISDTASTRVASVPYRSSQSGVPSAQESVCLRVRALCWIIAACGRCVWGSDRSDSGHGDNWSELAVVPNEVHDK